MVAKNEDGTLMTVPELILESHVDVRRFHDAKRLKEKRREIMNMLHREIKDMTDDQIAGDLVDNRCVIRIVED